MVFTTVGVLEEVRARFTLLSLELREVSFFICFATPPKLAIIFRFMRSIALNGSLNMVEHSCISPLLAILALRDTRIHIGTLNGSNILSNIIEASIGETFSLTSVLDVLNVKPYDWHVRFGQYFDYTWFWGEDNVIKDLILFNDSFNIVGGEMLVGIVVGEKWNAYNFQIGLRL